MTAINGGAGNTDSILRRSLQELREREEKLRPFIAEIEDVKRGIKTLEKALGETVTRRKAPASSGGTSRMSPRARFGERVLELLQPNPDGLSAEDIAGDLGRDNDDYLHGILSSLMGRGSVELRGDRYVIAGSAAA